MFANRVSELLDYNAEDITDVSLYSLCHGEDVHKIRKTHEDRKGQSYLNETTAHRYNIGLSLSVLNKGQVMSNYYRLINKTGGYTWLQSCATLICNTKNAEEQSIICVNYVLSGPQYGDVIMDRLQMAGGKDECGATVKTEKGAIPHFIGYIILVLNTAYTYLM